MSKHAKNGKPCLPDIRAYIRYGIDYETGMPSRISESSEINLKGNMKRFFRIIDEQDAVNRGTWFNLPCNITSQELERLLYYKGQLCFFYLKELDEFYFMPYALDGTIDFYGRFNTIHPVPMTSGTTEDQKKLIKQQEKYLSSLKLNCVYGIIDPVKVEDPEELMTKSCVLLHDYTKQLSQEIIPRKDIQDCIIDVMAEMIPLMRTNFYNNSGVEGVRVQDADQANSVIEADKSVKYGALTGQRYIPIEAPIDFQELTGSGTVKSEEYMLALQSLDNLRLSGYGLENGGVFEKKAHVLSQEEAVNSNNTGLIAQDATSIRQNFCNIVNSIWNLGLWYEPSQNETMADMDGDGLLYDRNENGKNGGIDNGTTNDTDL